MLTKDQAEVISDELLQQQDTSDVGTKNAQSRRTPAHFASAKLAQLQLWEQEKVVKAASRNTNNNRTFVLVMFAWLVLCAVTWSNSKSVVLFTAMFVVGGFAIRTWFIRRAISTLLAARMTEH